MADAGRPTGRRLGDAPHRGVPGLAVPLRAAALPGRWRPAAGWSCSASAGAGPAREVADRRVAGPAARSARRWAGWCGPPATTRSAWASVAATGCCPCRRQGPIVTWRPLARAEVPALGRPVVLPRRPRAVLSRRDAARRRPRAPRRRGAGGRAPWGGSAAGVPAGPDRRRRGRGGPARWRGCSTGGWSTPCRETWSRGGGRGSAAALVGGRRRPGGGAPPGRRRRSAVPPGGLPLALASLAGVWAGVPETSAALLVAGVLVGLAGALRLGGLTLRVAGRWWWGGPRRGRGRRGGG